MPILKELESKKAALKKTEKAVLGSAFSLSCSLPRADIELCSWSREGGAEMFQQEGKLLDYRRREIEGITVEDTDTK